MLVLAVLGTREVVVRAEAPVTPPRASPLLVPARSNRWFLRRPGAETRPPVQAPHVDPPQPVGEQDFNSCKKASPGKRVVPVSLKPDTDILQLITWISSVTCKSFVLSDNLGATRRKVTIVAPAIVTPEQAFRIFLDALNSVGLTVEPLGRFYQVIENTRAKSRPIPLYGWDGRRLVYTGK